MQRACSCGQCINTLQLGRLLRSFTSLLPGVGTKVESCSNCLIQNQSAKSIQLPAWGKSNSFTFLQQTSCLLSAVSHSFSTSRISRAFLEILRSLCRGWTSGSPGRGKQDNRTDGTMQSSRPVCNVHPRAPCRLHFTKLLHAPGELFHPPSWCPLAS